MQDCGLRAASECLQTEQLRRLDTSRLAMQMSQARKQLQERMSPAQIGLGEDCTAAQCHQLLNRLSRPWCLLRATRKFRRHVASGTSKVCSGFVGMHFHISGEEFNQPESARIYSRQEFDNLFAFRHTVDPTQMLEIRQVQLGVGLDSWEVLDQCANGFRLLRSVAGKKVEQLIARLAQKARASGIHLILATQRPSVDVITGLIKANIPTRMSFQVSSKIDSRTILDQMGAEALLGQGDMLFLAPGTGYPTRVHGAFVADDEVHHVVDYLKRAGVPDYVDGVLTGAGLDDEGEDGNGESDATVDAESDPLYDQAVEIVLKNRRASISLVQRHLRIGYNRSARLIEAMEKAGLVSAMDGRGGREVVARKEES